MLGNVTWIKANFLTIETTIVEYEPTMDNIAINNSLCNMRPYGGVLDEDN